MSQVNQRLKDSSPDYVYYDVVVSNIQSTTTAPTDFYYNDNRTQPYIKCPEDYALTILRFTLDTALVPVFIPTIAQNTPRVGDGSEQTIYSVTLSYQGQDVQSYVYWRPQDQSAPIPAPTTNTPNNVQDNSGGYYNCYNYSWWIYLVYLALKDAWEGIQALFPDDPLIQAGHSPLITWDSSSSSAVMYYENELFDSGNPDGVSVYMNAPLYSLFSSFVARIEGYTNVQYGRNVRLLMTNTGNIDYVPITNPNDPEDVWYAIPVYQEYSTISAWSPIVSMVFTSATLPIEPNQVSTPLIFNNGEVITSSNNNAISNIITDLVSDTGNYRPNLVYLPTAENRYIHLYGNRPLTNLDLQIFYKLRTGDLIPFKLQSGGSATMKIAFVKKTTLGK